MNDIEKLVNKSLYSEINKLYENTTENSEYEFIFSNRIIGQEKYINLLKFLNIKKVRDKLRSEGPIDSLDLNYADDKENTYRITIYGSENINQTIRKLDIGKNHVIFSTLIKLFQEKKLKDIEVMKKSKESDNTIDIDDLNMRVRLSTEDSLTKDDYKKASSLDHTHINNIVYRLKQRYSLYLLDTESEFVRIDLTNTKTNRSYAKLNQTVTNYELEIEYGLKKGKPSKKAFEIMINEIILLHKIIQQSNFIMTKTKEKEVVDYYKSVANVNEKATYLDSRQPISLEIQHLIDTLPDKYAVTDKADGERYFLIIMKNHCYFISGNLNVRDSGIELKNDNYDGSILDGEYIFIPKLNRHLFMVFDCLYSKGNSVKGESSFMKRLKEADKIIDACFKFGKQTGFSFDEYQSKGDFNLDDIVKYHTNQIKKYMDSIDNDIKLEIKLPLIRRKYFIDAKGAKKWEIFRYSELLWKLYTEDSNIKCPYLLDGLIYHPLEQPYETVASNNKFFEFKWKPPQKNSIDFYIQFEKDKVTNKVLTVYDNSNEDYVRNKPYKICRLYVGKKYKFEEQPVLFRQNDNGYWAYLFLDDGEVKDIENNIVTDNTVVEFYYNNDPEVPERFRWVPIRTRYDKTESVLRFGKKYGNYIDIANKVWRSITNPILISDFSDLAKGNNPEKNLFFYDKKIDIIRGKIGNELISTYAKENSYYKKISNTGKEMRQFHNWLKSNIIYTHFNYIYEDNKQQSILDIACGRGGDILKFYLVKASFYVGIDISKEGLISPVDGAISRYNKDRRSKPDFPKMYFIHGDARGLLDYESQNKILGGMTNDNKQLIEKFFGNKKTLFDRVNCQFAIHYFLQDEISWSNFKTNLNNTLRAGGYFVITHFDARKLIESFGNTDKITGEYTDENGKKIKLFEITKKFENVDTKKPIGVGHAVDLYAEWMFNENETMTEYLVDYQFLKEDLEKDCDVELVETDMFQNQFKIHEPFLKEYCKYEKNPKTRAYLMKVTEFYGTSEVIKATQMYSFLNRYCVFRKKEHRDVKKQKGGNLDFTDSDNYYVNKLSEYDNDYSYMSAIHSVLRSHGVIPKTLNPIRFYKDFDIKLIKDKDIDVPDIKNIAKKLVIYNDIDVGGKVASELVLNGLNVFVVERDCNDDYDTDFIAKGKYTDRDKAIILMRDGDFYKPVYRKQGDKKRGLFKMSDDLIKEMILNADEY